MMTVSIEALNDLSIASILKVVIAFAPFQVESEISLTINKFKPQEFSTCDFEPSKFFNFFYFLYIRKNKNKK